MYRRFVILALRIGGEEAERGGIAVRLFRAAVESDGNIKHLYLRTEPARKNGDRLTLGKGRHVIFFDFQRIGAAALVRQGDSFRGKGSVRDGRAVRLAARKLGFGHFCHRNFPFVGAVCLQVPLIEQYVRRDELARKIAV